MLYKKIDIIRNVIYDIITEDESFYRNIKKIFKWIYTKNNYKEDINKI